MKYEITIPGRPITKKNHGRILRRKDGTPFLAPSKQFAEYQERAGYFIRCKNLALYGPVNVKCRYYMPTKHRVDLANLLSATCDVLTHYRVILDDNSRVIASHDGSRVLYDKENPRVEITIEGAMP